MASEEQLDGIEDRIARGNILRFIRSRHREQKHPMDHVKLWHMLRAIGVDLGEYDVKTFLQDMQVNDLITFLIEVEEKHNRKAFIEIKLTAKGLAVLERRVKDDSVII